MGGRDLLGVLILLWFDGVVVLGVFCCLVLLGSGAQSCDWIDMFARFVNWMWGYVGWFVFVVLCGGWCCFVWFWMVNVLLGFVLSV